MGFGTLLNPLNSSMLAVGLVALRDEFGLSVAEVSWIVTVFYLTSAVAQPLMGRVADVAGPRRAFLCGMVVVAVMSTVAPFAPNFTTLCMARVVISIGSSAAYPAALSIIRRRADQAGIAPMAAIARVQLGNSLGVVLGPAIGGLVVSLWHWGVLFWLSVPLALIAFAAVMVLVGPDDPLPEGGGRQLVAALDLPSVALFATTVVPLLVFFSGVGSMTSAVLVTVGVGSAVLLSRRSRRIPRPFIDLDLMTSSRVVPIYLGFCVMTTVYYCAFYGLPQYLEGGVGIDPGQVGLLMVPLAGAAILANPLVAKALLRFKTRWVLLAGAVWMVAASSLVLFLTGSYDPVMVLLICAALGVPYCITTLGYSKAIYDEAPATKIGVATGMLQTCRHVGGAVSTIILSLVFSAGLDPGGLTVLVVVMVVGCLVAVTAVLAWRTTGSAAFE
jgi:predicted MFS family arabinose efflux permease